MFKFWIPSEKKKINKKDPKHYWISNKVFMIMHDNKCNCSVLSYEWKQWKVLEYNHFAYLHQTFEIETLVNIWYSSVGK